MPFGKSIGASRIFVELIRNNCDFLMRRLTVPIRSSKCTGRDIKVIVGVAIHES